MHEINAGHFWLQTLIIYLIKIYKLCHNHKLCGFQIMRISKDPLRIKQF